MKPYQSHMEIITETLVCSVVGFVLAIVVMILGNVVLSYFN